MWGHLATCGVVRVLGLGWGRGRRDELGTTERRQRVPTVPRHLQAAPRRQGAPDPAGEVPRPARARARDDPRPGTMPLRVPDGRVPPDARPAATRPAHEQAGARLPPVSYTHLRAHETRHDLV